jgi:hypothetical protein
MLSHALQVSQALFSLSVVTVTPGKGHASKRIILGPDGLPIKDPNHCLGISAGRIQHVRVPSLVGLQDLLLKVQPNQALVHGVPKQSTPGARYRLVGPKSITAPRIPSPAP